MKRVNITISDAIYDYYKTRSKRTGISMSALMAVQLEREFNEQTTLNQLPDLIRAYNDLQGGNK